MFIVAMSRLSVPSLVLVLSFLLPACAPPPEGEDGGVRQARPQQVKALPSVFEVPVGRPFGVEVTGVFSDGERRLVDDVQWLVDAGRMEALGQADELGRPLLRAVETGELVLRPSYRGVVGEPVRLKVTEEVLESIRIVVVDDTRLRWPQGSEVQLRAIGRYSLRGNWDVSEQVEWSSADESVARVTPEGRLQALAVGQTRVNARLGELSAEREVSIDPPALVEVILQATGDMPVTVGGVLELQVNGRYSDGRDLPLDDYTVVVADGTAQVAVEGGRVVALSAGEVSLVARSGRLESAPLVLNVTGATLARLEIGLASTLLPAGVSLPLEARAWLSDGTPYTQPLNLDWSLSGEGVLALRESGETGMAVEALAPGTVELRVAVANAGISASLPVTVVEAGQSTVQLSGERSPLRVTELRRLGVVGMSADGEIGPVSGVSCRSSDSTVISVMLSPGGCDLLAVAPGEASISVEDEQGGRVGGSVVLQVEALPEIGDLRRDSSFMLESSALAIDARNSRRLQAVITGAEPGQDYLLHARPLNGVLDSATRLWVSPEPALVKGGGACLSYAAAGRARLSCVLRAGDDGRIHVGVEDSQGGTPLRLWLSAGTYANQGRPDAPWPLELDQPVDGEVSANAFNFESLSHYRIDGLAITDGSGNQVRYRVSLLEPTETVVLRVGRPGGEELCAAPAKVTEHLPGQAIECLVDAGRQGALSIRVYGFDPYSPVLGASADGGARYRLVVSQEPYH